MGIWIYSIVAAIVVWDLTRSTLLVGLVSAAQFAPQLLLAPWSGARADRGDRTHQLMLGWGIMAAITLILAAAFSIGAINGTSGAALVILGTLISGVGIVIGLPPQHALVPSIVRDGELPLAIALNSLPATIARAGGPALGAALLTYAGGAIAMAVVASMFGCFVWVAKRLPGGSRSAGASLDSDASARAGFRWLRTQPSMVSLLFGMAAVGIGADPVITLTPALAEHLGEAQTFVGWLASAFGVGTAAGVILTSRMIRVTGIHRLAAVGLSMLGTALVAAAIGASPLAAILAFGFAGIGLAFALTALTTLIQSNVPDEFRGRMMAFWGVSYVGVRPIAAPISGIVSDNLSVDAALITAAVLVLISGVVARPARIRTANERVDIQGILNKEDRNLF